MNNSFLLNVFIFLAAAALVVPLVSRFKLGSVIGYLVIGVAIGPFGFQLLGNAQQIMHFAEFGVVMMLFLIGLELEPAMLWRLRHLIIGLGGTQVLCTTIALTLVGILAGFSWKESLGVSMALSLSSTALVLQMLQEKNLLRTVEGETSFSVLLFQDISVIVILIIMPLLAGSRVSSLPPDGNLLAAYPQWMQVGCIIFTIALVVISGHFFSRHLFFMVAKSNLREVFTATSLALVVGISLLMETIGASPALGAFVAGVVLANSEYKRTLEIDIEPFKGLLLGLFFISVGMGINFNLLGQQPVNIIMSVVIILLIKALILVYSGKLFGLSFLQRVGFAIALSQVGEFAFVLLQFAKNMQVINSETNSFFTLVVALSMATTPLLMLLYYRVIIPRFMSSLPQRPFDPIKQKHPIILVGYGRFGQIIGRFLSAQKIDITILEKDPDQVELLHKFGFQGYFGDASRLDLLTNAGAKNARLLIVAVDDADTCLDIVSMAKQHFPHLKIFARARNRRHAYELHKAGVDYFKRETFDSSLSMATAILVELGHKLESVRRKARLFAQLDEKSLLESFAFFEEEKALIDFSKEVYGELERILRLDQQR